MSYKHLMGGSVFVNNPTKTTVFTSMPETKLCSCGKKGIYANQDFCKDCEQYAFSMLHIKRKLKFVE